MKRILFPTDFSPAANVAFLYALQFANLHNAEVVMLHVYDLPIVESTPMANSTTDIFDIVEMNQFESFRNEMPELRKIAENNNLGHVPLRNILLYGDLLYTINKVCKDEEIDLIVMGTKGATGLKETFLGSTTGSVITNSKVPVLGIPANGNFRGIKNIAFTTQYLDKDNDAFNQTLEIAGKFHSRIHSVYIEADENAAEADARIYDWKSRYMNENVNFVMLSGSDKEQVLLDFINEKHIDLLVTRTHKRGFFENLFHKSLTKKMTYHTQSPILIFPDK